MDVVANTDALGSTPVKKETNQRQADSDEEWTVDVRAWQLFGVLSRRLTVRSDTLSALLKLYLTHYAVIVLPMCAHSAHHRQEDCELQAHVSGDVEGLAYGLCYLGAGTDESCTIAVLLIL